jgi:hypothetical protein
LVLTVAVAGGCHVRPSETPLDLAAPAAGGDDLGVGGNGGVGDDLATGDDDGGAAAGGVDWSRQVIYLALVDRFANGSTANDALGLAGCFDPADPQKWHGGDFVGPAGQARLPARARRRRPVDHARRAAGRRPDRQVRLSRLLGRLRRSRRRRRRAAPHPGDHRAGISDFAQEKPAVAAYLSALSAG